MAEKTVDTYKIHIDTNGVPSMRGLKRDLDGLEEYFKSHGDRSRSLTMIQLQENNGVVDGSYLAFSSSVSPINLWGMLYHPETGYIVMSREQPYICVLDLKKAMNEFFGGQMTLEYLNSLIGEYKLGNIGFRDVVSAGSSGAVSGKFSYLYNLVSKIWEKSIIWKKEETENEVPLYLNFVNEVLIKEGVLGFFSNFSVYQKGGRRSVGNWDWVNKLDPETLHFIFAWFDMKDYIKRANSAFRMLPITTGNISEEEDAEKAIYKVSAWDGSSSRWEMDMMQEKSDYEVLLDNVAEILEYRGNNSDSLSVYLKRDVNEIKQAIENSNISSVLNEWETLVGKEGRGILDKLVKMKEDELEGKGDSEEEDLFIPSGIDEKIAEMRKTWLLFTRYFERVVDIIQKSGMGKEAVLWTRDDEEDETTMDKRWGKEE